MIFLASSSVNTSKGTLWPLEKTKEKGISNVDPGIRILKKSVKLCFQNPNGGANQKRWIFARQNSKWMNEEIKPAANHESSWMHFYVQRYWRKWPKVVFDEDLRQKWPKSWQSKRKEIQKNSNCGDRWVFCEKIIRLPTYDVLRKLPNGAKGPDKEESVVRQKGWGSDNVFQQGHQGHLIGSSFGRGAEATAENHGNLETTRKYEYYYWFLTKCCYTRAAHWTKQVGHNSFFLPHKLRNRSWETLGDKRNRLPKLMLSS